MKQQSAAKVFLTALLSLNSLLIAQAQGRPPEVLYRFSSNAGNPIAPLTEGADGNFYGTTQDGGEVGRGTVFKMTPSGEFTTLASFSQSRGYNPDTAPLTVAGDGNLYGTTEYGGSNGVGTIFRITTNGVFTVLVNFNHDNGAYPRGGGLTLGRDGDLYGTTSTFDSSHYYGTVFKMKTSGDLLTLAQLTSDYVSTIPEGHLTLGRDNNFYGTTYSGTVFQMTTNAVFRALAENGGRNNGGLTLDKSGQLYGTTFEGGLYGRGSLYKVGHNGRQTTLVDFDGTNGMHPYGTLVFGNDNHLYGTTIHGGTGGEGTVFRISPTGSLATLFNFNRTNALGWGAYGGLRFASDKYLYGVTGFGGTGGGGVIFRTGLPPSVAPLRINRLHGHGTTVRLTAEAAGTLPLTYQWMKNGTNLADGRNIFGANRATLVISNLQTNDAGSFSVVVRNDWGSETSSEAILTVLAHKRSGIESLQLGDTRSCSNTLSFVGVPHSRYLVQWTSDILAGPWFTLSTNTAGSDGTWRVVDPSPAGDKRFYRVVAP